MTKIKAYDPKKQKEVLAGETVGTQFVKTVDSSKHMLHIMQAYGVQESVFQQLLDTDGILSIRIDEKDTGNRYEASLEVWEVYGVVKDFNGEQRFLPRHKMTKIGGESV